MNGNFKKRRQKVFVAMSGGVDSSVAALLLKQKEYDVTGVFMKNWTEARPNSTLSGISERQSCEWKKDRRDAMRVCAKINIPFLTFDFTEEYRAEVINYMLKEYSAGRTPNPDVMCNKKIKFGVFLKKAKEMGADYIATGHYARLRRECPISNFQFPISASLRKNALPARIFLNKSQIPNSKTSRKPQVTSYKLLTARDTNKDQSYFLWTLKQNQLRHCLFPIGDYLKSEVREIALKAGLPTADKKDSQGLCFVGKVKFRDFLNNLISQKFNKNSRPRFFIKNKIGGKIIATNGKIIGEHQGLEFYTIGQRHGIGIGGGKPYFVVEKDVKKNILIVAHKNDPALYKKEVFVKNVNWISPDIRFRGLTPEIGCRGSKKNWYQKSKRLKCKARIRYRQSLQDCEVYAISENRLKVLFKKPAWAVAPGQSIVFYKNQEMPGGGVINR